MKFIYNPSLLLRTMLDYDPKRRITLAEALHNKFIKPSYEELQNNQRLLRSEQKLPAMFIGK